MFVVHSYPLAVVFCVITMFCWGSWANTRKLARPGWRFELFYWDYTLGVLLLTLMLGLTLGSSGTEGRAFLADLAQASGASIVSALIGGAIFNLANILLVAAIEIAGMAVAFPVGHRTGADHRRDRELPSPPRSATAPLLAVGVVLVILAIVLDAVAYRAPAAARRRPRSAPRDWCCRWPAGYSWACSIASSPRRCTRIPSHAEIGKMGPYAAVFVFAVGVFLSSFVWNTFAMKKPFVGTPVGFRDYFAGASART